MGQAISAVITKKDLLGRPRIDWNPKNGENPRAIEGRTCRMKRLTKRVRID
jgi:hypothetical protein